jgi:hypothetical protein
MAINSTTKLKISLANPSNLQVKLDNTRGIQPISKITLPSSGGAGRLDQLFDVIEPPNASNKSTLVYNSETDKYEVKLLDLDGGSF